MSQMYFSDTTGGIGIAKPSDFTMNGMNFSLMENRKLLEHGSSIEAERKEGK
jgi:hypothetical protein